MQKNSITLTTEQADAFRLDAELRQHANTVVGEMIEIGRCLKEISERKLYLLLDAGTFAEYAEKAVGLKERAAYNYIAAYETYGEQGLQQYGQLGITKLVALAQLNDEDRTEMLESGKAEELSTRKLSDEIKKLKGENDQLRFQFDDITDNVKKQDAEIADKDAEIADLKKQLEEAQRPVVASMTDDEKEEIRREAEKKARADADKEVERWKSMKEKDAKTYEKVIKEYAKEADEHEERINELKQALEAATAANAELQALAEKEKKPVIAGSKEALKFCLEDIQQQFNRAAEIVEKMDGEEKSKFKAALVTVSDKCRSVAEGIE